LSITEQVEDAVVEQPLYPQLPAIQHVRIASFYGTVVGPPHAVRVEIGVIAEADAHSHQGEGHREAQQYDEQEDPEHDQRDDWF
jgi:hypothetical protein